MSKRICVVGAGRWGGNHIKTLVGLESLAGIVETDESRRAALAKDYPNVALYKSLHEAVEQPFDGYTVATPAETHFNIAEYLLRQKKHVLVEKPLALNSTDARRLKAIADENGATLMVGHVLLFHPAIRRIRELIGAGRIGKLQYLYSNRLNLGTVRTEENILWSFAPHDISIFQHLIGSRPLEVVSRGGAFVQPQIHDSTMTVLTYPGNVIGHVFVSWLHPFKEHRLVVIGSKGMLSFEDSTQEKNILFYEKGVDLVKGEPIARDGPTEVIAYDRTAPLTEELRYFLNHLDGKRPAIADAASAIEVLEILEKATESVMAGQPVRAESPTSTKNYFVHPSAYVDDNVKIGANTKIWHFSHVQPGAIIGANCSLGQNVNVANNVRIGNHVKIQNNVSVYEGVELEDYVFCGPSMVFTNVKDPRCKYPQRGAGHYLKTLVREGASLGANCTIVCGHTVGRHAFIAAGAVVTKDVPDYAMMAGVPARRIGWACECGERLPKFAQTVSCPRCKRDYRLENELLTPASV